jgi:hypothetical protein
MAGEQNDRRDIGVSAPDLGPDPVESQDELDAHLFVRSPELGALLVFLHGGTSR